jgi:hypothetical protein
MKKFVMTALAATLAASPAIAQDNSIAALREQLNQLQARIEQMEKERQAPPRATAAAPANVVTGGDTPGSFKLPGSDTSVQIGGYLKLDAIYNRDQDLGDTLFVEGLSTGGGTQDGKFRLHARESRLVVKTSSPNGLRTHLEADFFGASGNEVFTNSDNFRIRHAYGEFGGFLAGQTWTNFMHFAAYPATVDFDGPVGVSFLRQAQLRYTFPVGPGSLSIAAENPEGTGFAGAKDSAPDFTARYSWNGANSAIEAATVVRRLAYDSAAGDDAATGYGLLLAGNIGLGPATKLMGGVIWGDGIGRYLYAASGASDGSSGIGAAYIDAAGKLETIEAYGFNVAASHEWTKKFSSSLSYGQVRGDRPADLFPTSTEKLESIHFSHFYQVADPVTLGFEISRAAKKLQNGDSAHALRFQASAKYAF